MSAVVQSISIIIDFPGTKDFVKGIYSHPILPGMPHNETIEELAIKLVQRVIGDESSALVLSTEDELKQIIPSRLLKRAVITIGEPKNGLISKDDSSKTNN
jgi:hypothetical protein